MLETQFPQGLALTLYSTCEDQYEFSGVLIHLEAGCEIQGMQSGFLNHSKPRRVADYTGNEAWRSEVHSRRIWTDSSWSVISVQNFRLLSQAIMRPQPAQQCTASKASWTRNMARLKPKQYTKVARGSLPCSPWQL